MRKRQDKPHEAAEQVGTVELAEALVIHSAIDLGRLLVCRNVERRAERKKLATRRIERQIRRLGIWVRS